MSRDNGGVIGPAVPTSAPVCAPASTNAFTADGTYTKPNAAIQTVDVLVVAGGGGGSACKGGGGGGGGVRFVTGVDVSQDSTVAVTVGGGGTAGTGSSTGQKGNDSIFAAAAGEIRGTGGGKSGRAATDTGGQGGSGGGGSGPAGQGNVPPFSPPQGNPAGQQPQGHGAGGGFGGSGSGASPGAGAQSGTPIGAPSTTWSAGGAGGSSGSPGPDNSGTGGQGQPPNSTAGTGGSGFVFVKTPAYNVLGTAPGVWDLQAVYQKRKADAWPTN